MADLIVVVVLLLIVGAATVYIVKAKKKGVKCIGCPAGGNCSSKKDRNEQCSCGCRTDINE